MQLVKNSGTGQNIRSVNAGFESCRKEQSIQNSVPDILLYLFYF